MSTPAPQSAALSVTTDRVADPGRKPMAADEIAALFCDRLDKYGQRMLTVNQVKWLRRQWEIEFYRMRNARWAGRVMSGTLPGGSFWTVAILPNGAGILKVKEAARPLAKE